MAAVSLFNQWRGLAYTAPVLSAKKQTASSKGQQTPSVNPLLNPLIVAKVFHNLDLKTLLKCRLVCTVWNKEVTRKHNVRRDDLVLRMYGEDTIKCCVEALDVIPRSGIHKMFLKITHVTKTVIQLLSDKNIAYTMSDLTVVLAPFELERLLTVASTMPRIERITVIYSADIFFEDQYALNPPKRKKKEHLEIPDHPVLTVRYLCLKNGGPSLPYQWDLTQILCKFLKCTTELETLELDNWMGNNAMIFEAIAKIDTMRHFKLTGQVLGSIDATLLNDCINSHMSVKVSLLQSVSTVKLKKLRDAMRRHSIAKAEADLWYLPKKCRNARLAALRKKQ